MPGGLHARLCHTFLVFTARRDPFLYAQVWSQKKILHGTQRTAINDLVDDGLLIIAPSTLVLLYAKA